MIGLSLALLPAHAGTISLGWSAVDAPDLDGYRRDSGSASGEYTSSLDVGKSTEFTVFLTPNCQTYHLTVRSVGLNGAVSAPSPEVAGWPRPAPMFVSPSSLPAGSQVELTLNGVNFQPGGWIEFDDPAITVLEVETVSCYQMHALVSVGPDAEGGTSDLMVLNPDRAFGNLSVMVVRSDFDLDGDGFLDDVDNCPGVPNPGQHDLDQDGVGNLCETPAATSEMLAYWSMDASAALDGKLLDLSGNGFDLTLAAPTWVDGAVGDALLLDPADVDSPRAVQAPALEAAFTVTAWIRLEPPETDAVLLHFAAGGHDYLLSTTAGGSGLSVSGLLSDQELTTGPGTLSPGQWQHVAVTHGEGTLRFYVDGLPVGVHPTTHDALPALGTLTVGRDDDGGHPFRGDVDELRVYRGTLSAEAVANLIEVGGVACADADGDGFGLPGDPLCTGGMESDCDDVYAERRPGAYEWCGDWIDQDCNGADLTCGCIGDDDDGWSPVECGGDDCDDTNGQIHPDAAETCNAIDDDCDGWIDEGLSCGLAAHWTLDDVDPDSGAVADSSGNDHWLTVYGADAADGWLAGAFEFRIGENDYLEADAGGGPDLTGAFTIAAWIHPDTFGQDHVGTVVDKYRGFAADGYALRLYNQNGYAGLSILGLNEQSPVQSLANVITLGTWQHVAAVYDSGWLSFYVDGQPAGDVPVLHDPRPTTRGLRLGNDLSRATDFNGVIDDVRIYDRALDAQELLQLAAD